MRFFYFFLNFSRSVFHSRILCTLYSRNRTRIRELNVSLATRNECYQFNSAIIIELHERVGKKAVGVLPCALTWARTRSFVGRGGLHSNNPDALCCRLQQNPDASALGLSEREVPNFTLLRPIHCFVTSRASSYKMYLTLVPSF